MGYVEGARELATQVRAGAMPEPDVCVVALGSGGTAAGLAVGFEAERMKTRVVGVCVSGPPWALRAGARLLARACAGNVALEPSARAHLRLARLSTDPRFLGRGYGERLPDGDEVARIASAAGLALDTTYTEKAFASALWHVRARRGRTILYWHTLSSAPMHRLLATAPLERTALSPSLGALLS
jgi:D-cysteine desulfhydrase